jgi:short-subunit dehydrogenase
MEDDMRGKLVLVTGASSGIGEATAELFARKGARVVLLARSADKLRKVVADIEAAGGEAAPYRVDLAEPHEVEAVCRRIKTERGIPDVIVNNAGAGRWLPLVETSLEEARAMIELPYLAAFYVTRMFLPDMIARGSGQIASVASPASYMVWPNACAYIAARHAVKGFTEALRAEMRGTGVDVTLVILGTVASSYWEHNPGSLEHLPRPIPLLMPELTTEQAAETIVTAIEQHKARVVRPWIFKVLFFFGAGG